MKLSSKRAVDVAGQQVATLYAQALLDAAAASGKIEETLAELDSLVTEVLDKLPHLEAVFTSALVPDDKKAELVDRLLKGRASPILLNFLKVLGRHGRLGVLRSIHQVAQRLLDEQRKVVRVEVATASPLSDELKNRLTESVRADVWPNAGFGSASAARVDRRHRDARRRHGLRRLDRHPPRTISPADDQQERP